MEHQNGKLDSVISQMKADDVKFVRFEFGDMYDVALSRIIPMAHVLNTATRGLGHSLRFLDWDWKYTDDGTLPMPPHQLGAETFMFPDLDTYTTIPWRKNTGRILIEPTINGQPVPYYPRTMARRQLDSLRKLGYSLLSAYEHEFWIVDKDTMEPYTGKAFNSIPSRSTLRNYADPDFTHHIITDLPKVGVDVSGFESETYGGQIEIIVKPAFGIKAADTSHTCRVSMKEIALEHGYMASCMTQPWPESSRARSSLHFNHSLWDIQGENNKMADKNSPSGLSKVARHWIAGILAHAPSIAILIAPTSNCLNSYSQYPTYTPINATWGFENKSVALRVKKGGNSSMHIESRTASAASNPYIVLAATVAAGIDGIKNEMEPPPEVKGHAFTSENIPEKTAALPTDMKTALENFKKDTVIRAALGDEFCDLYIGHKSHEILKEEAAKAEGNTNWERDTLFAKI